QCLAQHEPRLRKRPLGGVDEQQHAVDHGQPALDLAAEVRVAGRVDDVQLYPAITNCGGLGQDGDPLLSLEIHRVEDTVRNILRVTFPEERGVRMRDAVRAYLAGSGLNAIVPARGGDIIKVYFIDRRMQNGDWAKVVGTFVPEGLFEAAVGVALLVWGLARG